MDFIFSYLIDLKLVVVVFKYCLVSAILPALSFLVMRFIRPESLFLNNLEALMQSRSLVLRFTNSGSIVDYNSIKMRVFECWPGQADY